MPKPSIVVGSYLLHPIEGKGVRMVPHPKYERFIPLLSLLTAVILLVANILLLWRSMR
jgi:hypothetical protein